MGKKFWGRDEEIKDNQAQNGGVTSSVDKPVNPVSASAMTPIISSHHNPETAHLMPARTPAPGADWPDLFVGPNTKAEGDISSKGDVLIHGVLKGKLHADGKVTVAEGATVVAPVTCKALDLQGSIEGRVDVATDVTVGSKASLKGNARVGSLSLSQGANFSGSVSQGNVKEEVENKEAPKPRVRPRS